MSRYTEIQQHIQMRYQTLPRNQMKIADYFIENFDKIPFLSVQEIAAVTKASVASIVRFSQRIGFTGYSELRDEIAATLQNQLKKQDKFPLLPKSLNEDTLTQVANLDIKNINDTLNGLDHEVFESAVHKIVEARSVHTAGLGISCLLAEILTYQLRNVGIDTRTFNLSWASFDEQILMMNEKDLLICFSFPPYSKETIEAARFAKKNKIPVISITNRSASPISFYSDISLIVKSENLLHTNSFAASSVMINAIATECALKNKPVAQKLLRQISKATKNLYIE